MESNFENVSQFAHAVAFVDAKLGDIHRGGAAQTYSKLRNELLEAGLQLRRKERQIPQSFVVRQMGKQLRLELWPAAARYDGHLYDTQQSTE
jgi:hypothetical protein